MGMTGQHGAGIGASTALGVGWVRHWHRASTLLGLGLRLGNPVALG